MQKDFILVGQGISGTFLSWYLIRKGYSVLVIDAENPVSSSRVAAGMINPVTGRRMVKTWMIDTILPFAVDAYETLGKELGISAITQKNLIDFFPNEQMRTTFEERVTEEPEFLRHMKDDHSMDKYFNYHFGFGEIHPCFTINTREVFAAWKNELVRMNSYLNERFDLQNFVQNDQSVTYRDIRAGKIIFCDGVNGFDNPFFPNLPFAMNKGQALVLEIPDLPEDHIYKKSHKMVPLGNQYFWVGSSYEWNFDDEHPTTLFREKTTESLKNWLKLPFKVVEHRSALRPATLERRPFVGFHPKFNRIGMLNGMGTKGFSLAPYFANELANHIDPGTEIHPLADIGRFERILSRV